MLQRDFAKERSMVYELEEAVKEQISHIAHIIFWIILPIIGIINVILFYLMLKGWWRARQKAKKVANSQGR